MDWTKLVDWLKLSFAYFLAAAGAAAFMLFAPASLLLALGLSEFTATYRGWIAFALVVSSAVVLAKLVEFGAARAAAAVAGRSARKAGIARLAVLTPEEASVLAAYVNNETRTHHFQPSDGVVQGLCDESIVYRASDVGYARIGFAYNIQPWAFTHLKKHPDLLARAESTYVSRGGPQTMVRTNIPPS